MVNDGSFTGKYDDFYHDTNMRQMVTRVVNHLDETGPKPRTWSEVSRCKKWQKMVGFNICIIQLGMEETLRKTLAMKYSQIQVNIFV